MRFNDEGFSLPDIQKLLPDDAAKDDSESDTNGGNGAENGAPANANDKAKGSDKGDDSKDKTKIRFLTSTSSSSRQNGAWRIKSNRL